MKKGFSKITELVNHDEVSKLLKKYRSIKKYMKSSLYQIKTIDGTETIVKNLLEEGK